jgi:large subunit ribosomal protein L17
MGFRVGDNAPMAFVELVDRPDPGAAVEVAEDKS